MPAVFFTATLDVTVSVTDPVEITILGERPLVPLIQHMPQGRAWNLARGSVLWRLLRGVAWSFGAVDAYQRAVVRQLNPATATFALERWEELLDLSSTGLTLEERQTQAAARLRARGGQSAPYFQAMLEDLGYTNVVVMRLGDPFRCGDRIRKRLQNLGWMYTFLIQADSIPALDAQMMAAVRDGLRASVILHFELT